MADIVTETTGAVARLTFNRAEKHNAISLAMWDGIADALEEWARDTAIRVVILSGTGGRAFAAGADIGQFETERDNSAAYAEYERRAARGRAALAGFSKPVIAAVSGYCIGAGMGIAMAADLCIAAENATFAMPGARIGMPCDLAMGRKLVSVVGPLHARMILYCGDRIPAAEALRIGLVNRVVANDMLADEVSRLAASLAANAPLALYALKRIVDTVLGPPDEDRERSVRRDILTCVDSEDYREGRSAVLKKKRPRFQGH